MKTIRIRSILPKEINKFGMVSEIWKEYYIGFGLTGWYAAKQKIKIFTPTGRKVRIIRPLIMWGSPEEIRADIRRIIEEEIGSI